MEEYAVRAGLKRARSAIPVLPIAMGSSCSLETLAPLLCRSHIKQVLLIGVCGLLSPAFRSGDVLLYDRVRTQANAFVSVDGRLTASVAACLPQAKTKIGALTWPRIVTAADEKVQLGQRYGIDAVD